MDFIITIDTEADNQWSRPATVTTENTKHIPRFQALCDAFGFKPTYLCTYEMVTDPLFRDTLGPYQQSGRAEIGAHLHPWSSPPFSAEEQANGRDHAFPCELSQEVFEAKLQTLTEAIHKAFGRSPTSYRAGRYGFAPAHVDSLLSFGYRVDCSVAPFMSYVNCRGAPGGRGGADYREALPGAYFLGRDNLHTPGTSGLLEVPITILHTRWPIRASRHAQRWLVNHPRHPATRLLGRLGYGPQWLRPQPGKSADDLVRIFRAAQSRQLPCAEMMFHSSELMPGGSPYFPDAAAIEALYRCFERVFECAARSRFVGTTLSGFADRFSGRNR